MTSYRIPLGRITVDGRFLFASGIGVYLRSILAEIQTLEPDLAIRLLVRSAEVDRARQELPRAIVEPCDLPPLGIRNILRIGEFVDAASNLFWVPHFNFPFFYSGRTVVTLHDISIRHREMAGGLFAYLYSRLILPRLASRAASIVCDSEATRRDFFAHYQRRNQVYTVHPGLRPAAQAQYPAGQKPSILFIGNVKPHKNLQNLVRAFLLLEAEFPHELIIVGRMEGLRTQDAALPGIAAGHARIRLTGAVTDEELTSLMAGADLFVFPSLFEGFGFPPLEAMAAAVPVAASDIPVVREVCGNVPEYFDPRNPEDMAEAMRRILSNPSRQAVMKEAGLKHAATYSWKTAAQKTLAVLRQAAFMDRRSGPSVSFVREVMRGKRDALHVNDSERKARVTIITITLNAAVTVEGTIQSVLSQTYPDVEYILIDGGSSDGTQDIIEKYAARLSIWGRVSDSGISDAMNQAISQASGDIIGILHADDWHEPDAIKLSVAALEASPLAGYVCASLQYWKDGQRDAVFPSKPGSIGVEMTVNHATCFVRRSTYEAAGLFKPEYPIAMDYEFFLRLKGLGISGISLDQVTANMRYGGTSDRRWMQGLLEMRRAQKEIFGFHPRYLLAFPFKMIRSIAGRLLDRPAFLPLVRFYRSRISSFRRSYASASR